MRISPAGMQRNYLPVTAHSYVGAPYSAQQRGLKKAPIYRREPQFGLRAVVEREDGPEGASVTAASMHLRQNHLRR